MTWRKPHPVITSVLSWYQPLFRELKLTKLLLHNGKRNPQFIVKVQMLKAVVICIQYIVSQLFIIRFYSMLKFIIVDYRVIDPEFSFLSSMIPIDTTMQTLQKPASRYSLDDFWALLHPIGGFINWT